MLTPEPPVPIKPAPWTTKCASYWLLLNLRKLPEGVYDPLEASSPEFADPQLAGEFKGGLGMIMVVRYEDTPTGKWNFCFFSSLFFFVIFFPLVFLKSSKKGRQWQRIARGQTSHGLRVYWYFSEYVCCKSSDIASS